MPFPPQIRHWRRCRYCRPGAGDTSFVAGPTSSRQAIGAKERKGKANTVYAVCTYTYNYAQSLRKIVLFITIDDYMNISLFFSLLISYTGDQ